MSPYKSKGIRSQWTQQNLRSALKAIENGMSKSAASKQFNISRRTLSRYKNKSINEKQRLGRKTILKPEQEIELVSRIIRLAQVGYPLTKRMLRRCVYNYCEKNRIPHMFSQEKCLAGRYWLKAFLSRHPEISPRRAQNMNPARAQKLNKFIVADYFEKLKAVLVELDLMDKPERIYNVDEKGCRLTLHHQQTVLAAKGSKRVHLVAPEHAENVTVVSCGNAAGGRIPPAILFKGQRLKHEWCDGLPPGTLTLMTKKGSMTVETFNEWLKHLAKYKLPRKCLLIFDGASCHLDTSIVETADAHDITLFCLPSNTTHELQPMDKAVFKSFEYHWDEQVLLYWTRHKDRRITKQRFGEIFSIVWDKSVTPQNICSSFSATGIYPFNPHAIPEVAFAPSNLTEENYNAENISKGLSHAQENHESTRNRETTPQPGPSGCQKIQKARNLIENTPPVKLSSKSFRTKRQTKKGWSSSSSSSVSEDDISLYSDTASETFSSDDKESSENQSKKENYITGPSVTLGYISNDTEQKKLNTKCHEGLKNTEKVKESIQTKNTFNEEKEPQKSDEHKEGNIQLQKNNEDEEDLNVTFTEMLETPYKDTTKRIQRKAINSRAVVVKKAVFSKDNASTQKRTTNANRNVVKIKKVNQQTKTKESWYCSACKEDVLKDMRLCSVCLTYFHEECVGLTKDDKTLFICPNCC